MTYGVLNVVGQTPAQVAEQCHDAWGDTVTERQSTSVQLEETICKFGPDATGPMAVFSGIRPGKLAFPPLPPQCSYLVRKNTLQGGRAARGRMYIPGPLEQDVDGGGLLTLEARNATQVWLDTFQGEIEARTGGMVIHHDPDKNNYTPAPFDVSSLSVDDRIATQRRRLRG